MIMLKNSKLVIFMGALMILAGLIWMVEPYYTWAQEDTHPCRVELEPEEPLFELENMNPGDTYEESVVVTKTGSAPAELFFAWEYIEGDPGLDEEGDFEAGNLFDQLEMTVVSEGEEVFSGKMSDWQYDGDNPTRNDVVNLTGVLGMDLIRQGDRIFLDFKIHLPGPETGNEFQGSTLETRLIFFTVCTGNGNDDEDELVVAPEEPDLKPAPPPLEEEETVDEEIVDIVTPQTPEVDLPLPRTDGISVGLFTAGLLLILGSLFLKKAGRQAEKDRRL